MEFTLLCNYYSYLIGSRFSVWFSCSCLKPEMLEKMRNITSANDGLSVFQQRVLIALHYGDCRVSYKGSGMISFEGHEYKTKAEGEGIRVIFDEECSFLVTEKDVIDYLK